jgi:hypothetical protein
MNRRGARTARTTSGEALAEGSPTDPDVDDVGARGRRHASLRGIDDADEQAHGRAL